MFDHVTIRAGDRDAAERFYEIVLPTLGIEQTSADEHYAEWGDFSLAGASPEKPVTRRLHIGFVAPSRAEVDEFWRVGSAAGYRDDGSPGPRPQYRRDYYGSFLLDPEGNSVEAVHHGALREGGGIDHLWIRVSDVERSKRFYEAVAPHAGFQLQTDRPKRARFAGETGSFSVVRGTPTEDLHMAFPVRENGTVDAFHAALTAAGYADNGAPGERRIYHEGYYAAFVLDPDGNNIELVNHNRD
ncbi:MAG: VOC family protein [Actinomycetota bacterium]|nr:VOC family protein [Actinomycetota bacterium]